MINRKLKNVVLVLGVIGLLLIMYGNLFLLEKEIHNKEIPKTVYIQNNTNLDVELKTKLIVNRLFNIDSIFIKYEYMGTQEYINGEEVGAYIVKNPLFENQYVIYISKTLKPYHEDIILSHEMIHLYQYESCDLVFVNIYKGTMRFKEDTFLKEL